MWESSSREVGNQTMAEVFLSLGSNVDRERHIREALEELAALFGPLTVSSVYESEAVGFVGDPFYNLAVKFDSELPVEEIASRLRKIEIAHGRTGESRKFEPRTLDIDLLLYGDYVTKDDGLRLPRDGIGEYAFMLEPLAEIAPRFKHPSLGGDFASLWEDFDKSQITQKRLKM